MATLPNPLAVQGDNKKFLRANSDETLMFVSGGSTDLAVQFETAKNIFNSKLVSVQSVATSKFWELQTDGTVLAKAETANVANKNHWFELKFKPNTVVNLRSYGNDCYVQRDGGSNGLVAYTSDPNPQQDFTVVAPTTK